MSEIGEGHAKNTVILANSYPYSYPYLPIVSILIPLLLDLARIRVFCIEQLVFMLILRHWQRAFVPLRRSAAGIHVSGHGAY
jgi:hypothetical protein